MMKPSGLILSSSPPSYSEAEKFLQSLISLQKILGPNIGITFGERSSNGSQTIEIYSINTRSKRQKARSLKIDSLMYAELASILMDSVCQAVSDTRVVNVSVIRRLQESLQLAGTDTRALVRSLSQLKYGTRYFRRSSTSITRLMETSNGK